MPQAVQLAKTTLLFSSTKDAYLLVQMDIIYQAKFAKNVIALAVLVLEGQIQTVSHVELPFYRVKNVFLLAQMDIIHRAKFAITAIALATLVLVGQIQTVSPAQLPFY